MFFSVILWTLALAFIIFLVLHGIRTYLLLHRLGYSYFPPSTWKILKRHFRSKVLEIIIEDLKQHRPPREMLTDLFSMLADLLEVDAWSFLLTPEKGDWEFYVWSDPYDRLELNKISKQIQKAPSVNVKTVIRTGKPAFLKPRLWTLNRTLKAWIGVPVILEGKVVGVLNLDWFKPKSSTFLKRTAKLASLFVEDLTQVITTMLQLQKIFSDLRIYPITETYNRVALEEYCQHLEPPYTVIFIDLDGFKEVNDTAGHRVGDSVLAVVARRIRSAIRQEDMLFRYGGDEFIIITKVQGKGVESLVTRLLEVGKTPIKIKDKTFQIGLSVGTATVPEEADSIEKAIELADERMYRFKEEKRSSKKNVIPIRSTHTPSACSKET